MELARHKVARGAKLLDKQLPGWEKAIVPRMLRLSSCRLCVCGQLAMATRAVGAGPTDDGFQIMRQEILEKAYDRPDLYGFDSTEYVPYNALEVAWLEELERRGVKL
jgi:hypothetical protein